MVETGRPLTVRQRVVIIEDEPDIVDIVGYNVRKEGFDFESFTRGKEGMAAVRNNPPDIVLLDIMLPDENGLEICRRLRSDERLSGLPLVLLTARGEEHDRIVGLELGADDYVVKPFSPRELVARIKAILRRRNRQADASEVIACRDLRLEGSTHDVTVRGELVPVSALEFRLLYFLASHPRQVFSRERLLHEVWGDDRSVTPRTIDVHVRRLREKIELRPEHPEYIGTVRGVGYRFLPEPAA